MSFVCKYFSRIIFLHHIECANENKTIGKLVTIMITMKIWINFTISFREKSSLDFSIPYGRNINDVVRGFVFFDTYEVVSNAVDWDAKVDLYSTAIFALLSQWAPFDAVRPLKKNYYTSFQRHHAPNAGNSIDECKHINERVAASDTDSSSRKLLSSSIYTEVVANVKIARNTYFFRNSGFVGCPRRIIVAQNKSFKFRPWLTTSFVIVGCDKASCFDVACERWFYMVLRSFRNHMTGVTKPRVHVRCSLVCLRRAVKFHHRPSKVTGSRWFVVLVVGDVRIDFCRRRAFLKDPAMKVRRTHEKLIK